MLQKLKGKGFLFHLEIYKSRTIVYGIMNAERLRGDIGASVSVECSAGGKSQLKRVQSPLYSGSCFGDVVNCLCVRGV